MLLFRSEDHVDRWCAKRGIARGAVFSAAQMWGVAIDWHGTRLRRDWRRFTPEEAQRVFDRAGLVGEFWRFPGPAAAPNDRPDPSPGR